MKSMLLATLICVSSTAGSAPTGTGWTMTGLDLLVRVEKEDLSLHISGSMTLRLDAPESTGPLLWLNRGTAGLEWLSIAGPEVGSAKLNAATPGSNGARLAQVQLKKSAKRGAELNLEFEAEQVGNAPQLISSPEIALASWVEGWYPVPAASTGVNSSFTPMRIAVPGTTSFDLPLDWRAVSEGNLVSREQTGGRSWELWDLNDNPVARSFAVGPFHSAEREVDGRVISIHMLSDHVMGEDQLARLVAASMKAQEARLGPFPFPSYGIVEVPDRMQGWSAASQQTFIMATSKNFDHEHGNLPLWAHEMCHAWWGNTVASRGPGAKTVGEALAQFGALLSLEALEGSAAMIEFLEFSRGGCSMSQCAKGYFTMVEDGRDHPLATLATSGLPGEITHNLADSKGMWMYHMLRRQIGDEDFFATLRGLIEDFDGRSITLADLRRSFIERAPDQELEQFFTQWLDRTGAPRIRVAWSLRPEGRVRVVLTQESAGPPFHLDLELELLFDDGTSRREVVPVSARETTVDLDSPRTLVDMIIDPDRNHLLWRPTYAATPTVDGVELPTTAPWVDVAVYEGSYHIEMFNLTASVSSRGNELLIEVGEDRRRLYPHKPHRFLSHDSTVDFKVEDGRATGFSVRLNNGMTGEAVRVD